MANTGELVQAFEIALASEVSQDERDRVTKMILDFQVQPEAFPLLLDLIFAFQRPDNAHPKKDVVRQYAISCLARCLARNWKHTLRANGAEEAKAALLNLLRNESNLTIAHTLLRALKPVFKTDCFQWNGLFEFITGLSQSENWEHVEIAMYSITQMIGRLPPASVSENMQWFLQMAMSSLQRIDHPEMVSTAAGLIAVIMIEADDDEVAKLEEPFRAIVMSYGAILQKGDQSEIASFSEKLCFALGAHTLPVSCDELLAILFSFVQVNPVSAYVPIMELVSRHGRKISPDATANLIRQTLEVATALFIGDPNVSIKEMEDSAFIVQTIRQASKSMKKSVFFRAMLSLAMETMKASGASAATIVAAMAIDEVVSVCQAEVSQNMGDLCQFLSNVVSIDHLAAKEVFVETAGDMAKLFEDGENEMATKFIASMCELLGSGQPDLVVLTVKSLTKLLNCCDVPFEQIGRILEVVGGLFDSVPSGDLFACISALVFSGGEDIVPYTEKIFPLLMKATEVSEDADPILRANVIEAMSNMIRFASEKLGSYLDQALNFILQSGRTNDCDIRSAVMAAISNVLVLQLPGFERFAGDIKALIDQYVIEELQSEEANAGADNDNSEEDGNEFVRTQGQINSLTNTALLIKNIFKRAPNLIPSDLGNWPQFCISCMVAFSDDLVVAATLASLYITLKVPENMGPFCKALMDNLEESGTVVGIIFKSITTFMENGVEVPPEVATKVMEVAHTALKRELPCQADDMADDDNTSILNLQKNLYKFYACLATKSPQSFPVTSFIDHGKTNETSFEKSQWVGVLRQLFINNHEQIKGLTRKVIIQAFIENIPVCDFSVVPEPILALKNVYQIAPSEIQPKHLSSAVEFIWQLLEQENDGELNYWVTVTDAISFICVLIRSGSPLVPVEQWLPKILSLLPVRGDDMEAENIYSTIEYLVEQIGQGLGPLVPEVLRVYVLTIGMKEKVLASFRLSEETTQRMLAQMGALLPQSPEERKAVIGGILTDEMSRMRFSQRVPQLAL